MFVGNIGLRSLTDGHLGRHLEYFKTLNDARVASLGFIKFNAPTTRINKEKNFKIKFQVILVFYRTIIYDNNNSIHGHKSVYLSQVIRLFCPKNACPDQLMQKGNDPDIRFNLICRCL